MLAAKKPLLLWSAGWLEQWLLYSNAVYSCIYWHANIIDIRLLTCRHEIFCQQPPYGNRWYMCHSLGEWFTKSEKNLHLTYNLYSKLYNYNEFHTSILANWQVNAYMLIQCTLQNMVMHHPSLLPMHQYTMLVAFQYHNLQYPFHRYPKVFSIEWLQTITM